MAQESSLTPRRSPVQRRARETVDAILEGAAQVFAERGFASGTTNHIAVRAGVSIGSLYEYFPNKEAILVALVERHLETGSRLAREAIEAPGPLELRLRRFVEAMVGLHAVEPELHRVLFEEAPHPPESHACVLRMEESLAHALEAVLQAQPPPGPSDADTAAHFVVQTTEALAHRFVLHGLHDLPQDRFVDEVVRLLTRYLGLGTRG